MRMEERKSNILNILADSDRGLTLAQLAREYKRIFGRQLKEEGVDIEDTLGAMSGDVRSEKAAWGDTLYFLESKDTAIPLMADSDHCNSSKPAEGNVVSRCGYCADEQVKKLHCDSRGWCTICWTARPEDSYANIKEVFSTFGLLADVRLDSGKAFVRYTSKEAAEAAIRTHGAHLRIEAGRGTARNRGSKGAESDHLAHAMGERTPMAIARTAMGSVDSGISTKENEQAENTLLDEQENRSSLEIYVSDLPLDFDQIDLEEMFLDYDVRRIRVNASTNKRYAFVEFGSRDEVEKAVMDLCDDRETGRHYCSGRKTFVRLTPRDRDLKAKFTNKSERSETDQKQVSPYRAETVESSDTSRHKGDALRGDWDSIPAQISNLSITNGAASTLTLCRHASTPCKKYPNCRPNCDFQHPLCPRGVQCYDRFCSYDHTHREKKCHLCSKRIQINPDAIFSQCEHRKTACTDFPKCPYGFKCSFMHPKCPNVGCPAGDTCAYEHYGQRKICFICLKANWNEDDLNEAKAQARKNSKTGGTLLLKENVPCRYDVKCRTPQCPYKHPPEWGKRACPWGEKCRRDKCIFSHPPTT